MPFVITCPDCARTFRSAREREVGKGVECPKCGARFYVSAENQEEVRDDRPPRDDDRPARRRPRDDDEDDARPPARRGRNRDDEGRDAPPAPKGKGRGKVGKLLLILGLAGMVFVLAAGAGAYFLFFAGGGSAEDKVRPKRELPMDMFAYRPAGEWTATLHNFALGGEPDADPVYRPNLTTALPTGHGLTPEQIEFYCELRDVASTQMPPVVVVAFVNPVDGAAVAARCQMQPLPGKRPGLFSRSNKASAWVAFQPQPKQMVFVGSNFDNKTDLETLARVADRPASAPDLPPVVREGLAAVSGYAVITASVRKGGDQEMNFDGKYKSKAGIREVFAMRVYNSPEAARRHHESEKKIWYVAGKGSDSVEGKDGVLSRPRLWVRGDRNFYFHRQMVGKGP